MAHKDLHRCLYTAVFMWTYLRACQQQYRNHQTLTPVCKGFVKPFSLMLIVSNISFSLLHFCLQRSLWCTCQPCVVMGGSIYQSARRICTFWKNNVLQVGLIAWNTASKGLVLVWGVMLVHAYTTLTWLSIGLFNKWDALAITGLNTRGRIPSEPQSVICS